MRGTFGSSEPDDAVSLDDTLDLHEPDAPSATLTRGHQADPHGIGQDERRMQVRAYNHWATLLEDRMFPLIDALEPAALPDFGPYSVLIDFVAGIEDPAVRFLGDRLAAECSADGAIQRLSDVPPRSLLSRITDHYMQILANNAPIGFEAEFVNHRGASTLYRGILLPFSSNGETIDFLYGVINWKEIADQVTADELLLGIDQALDLVAADHFAAAEDSDDADEPVRRTADPVTTWADSPASERGEDLLVGGDYGNIASLATVGERDELRAEQHHDLPVPEFGEPDFAQYALDDNYDDDYNADEDSGEDETAGYSFASLADYIEAPVKKAIDPAAFTLDHSFEDGPIEGGGSAIGILQENHVEESHAEESSAEESAEDEFAKADIAVDSGAKSIVNPEHAAADDPSAVVTAPQAFAIPADDRSAQLPGVLASAPAHEVTSDFARDHASECASDANLYDYLAAARELAHTAHTTEDRSRAALYAAVGQAYDFSLAAIEAPEDYAELIADSGLVVQERAPMTPVVKLVFGADYDKTRLTEYAAVLTHAHRLKLERGTLARYLCKAEGGLKGVVKAERRLRREETGKEADTGAAVREALAEQLRALEALMLEALDGGGPEFALVMIRRDETGCAQLLGELPEDIGQLERAARTLVG